MRSFIALLIAATFATTVRAESVAFSYSWDLTVYTVGGDGQGNPVIIPSGSQTSGWSGTLMWSAAAAGSASAPGVNIPAMTFTHVPAEGGSVQVDINEEVSLKLTLTDAASGASGVLTFDGAVSEADEMPRTKMLAAFDGGPRSLLLGGNEYRVTLSPSGVDIPLTGGTVAIGATVGITPTLAEMPEPGTLALAALGTAGLIARRRLSRRRAVG